MIIPFLTWPRVQIWFLNKQTQTSSAPELPVDDDDFYYSRIKKGESQGKKCHARTMMHSEADKDFKMNTRHVPLRQIVEEIRDCLRRGVLDCWLLLIFPYNIHVYTLTSHLGLSYHRLVSSVLTDESRVTLSRILFSQRTCPKPFVFEKVSVKKKQPFFLNRSPWRKNKDAFGKIVEEKTNANLKWCVFTFSCSRGHERGSLAL